jgi:MFS family permease
MAALGALAMATIVNTFVGAMIAYGLIIGSASALGGTIPAQTLTSYWFRKRLALAITIVFTGLTIGGFVATPLLTEVVVASNGNWRVGWFVVAAVCAVSFCCAILFVRNKPSDIGQVQDGVVEENTQSDAKADSQLASGVYKTTRDWTFGESVRHPTFWLMVLGLVCAASSNGMLVAHGVAHFKDLGHSPAMAAMFLSFMILTGLAGNAVFAMLGDRIEPRFLWSAALIFMAIGMAMVVNATSNFELYATAFLLGAGVSVASLGMFTLAVNYFGTTPYASLMGVTGLFLTLVPATAITLTGIAFDHFGSYALAFYSAAVICFLVGLMMPFVVPPVGSCATAAVS